MGYLVLGAGAIGGTVGAGLVRDGHDVVFCDADREHVQAMNADGLAIEGPVEHFTVAVTALVPEDLPDRIDRVVLLAVKAHHTASAARVLRGRLSGGSHVVTLQNGLTTDAVAGEVGPDAVLPAFVNFGADRLGPGRILRGNRAAFRIGELDGRISERARRFAADVADVEVTDNILGYEWAKLAYGAWLYVTAVSGAPIHEVLADPRWEPVLLAVAGEVLGQAPVRPMAFDGFDPSDLPGSLARLAEFNRASAKTHSGIHRDLVVHRRVTEVDAHLAPLADPVRASLLHALVATVHAIEQGRRGCEPQTLALLAAHERIARLGRGLNAVAGTVAVPERAPGGALAGCPVAVKDIIAVAGVVTGYGSTLPPGTAPAETDATVVRRLRAAGAEVIALSQCLEYAAGAVHPQVGDTRNPHDSSRTSGGSSGGSAALVASGALSLAVGTDTGGSIRIPAAYCGVVGLKPTHGLVPTDGVFPLSPTCDHVGPLAADPALARLMLSVLAGLPLCGGTAGATRVPDRPPVLGILQDQLDDSCVTAEVRGAVSDALARLQHAGWLLVGVTASWVGDGERLGALLGDIVCYEAAAVHRDRLRSLRGHYGPGTLAVLAAGGAIDRSRYEVARAEARRLRDRVTESLAGLDAMAGPTVPTVAPEHDPPFDQAGDPEGRFTGPWNLTGHPAVSVPVPSPGLPVGLQLAGRHGHDAALLALAEQAVTVLANR